MPNFEGIPVLYKIQDITRRLVYKIKRVPHKDVPQDSTSLDVFWTELKIKNITEDIISGIPKVPNKNVIQDSTSQDIFWTDLRLKKKCKVLHVVLSWVNLDQFMHVHIGTRFFKETPNSMRKEYTVNDAKFERQKLEGSIQLYINGLRQFINQDYEETKTGIKLIGDTVIKSTDFAWCHYRKIAVGDEELNG